MSYTTTCDDATFFAPGSDSTHDKVVSHYTTCDDGQYA